MVLNWTRTKLSNCTIPLSWNKNRSSKNVVTYFPQIVEERYSDKTGKRLKRTGNHRLSTHRLDKQIASRLIELGGSPKNLLPLVNPR